MQDGIFLKNKLTEFLTEHGAKKKVIVVNSYDKIPMAAMAIRGIRGYLGYNTDVLCFKAQIPEEFNDFADKVKISEDYLAYEDYLKIDNYVFKDITKNWDGEVKKRFEDIFTYRDIELARIAEYDFQVFLIAKIKALAVMRRAIEGEKYEAVFIIDSNGELGNFDRLLSRQYSIPAVLAEIGEELSLFGRVKEVVSDSISDLVDDFAPFFIANKANKTRLMDARLFYQLGMEDTGNFILTPLEKGLRLRLRALFKGCGYIAFGMERRLPAVRSDVIRNFDTRALADTFIFEGINYWELVEDKVKSLIRYDFDRFKKNMDILSKAEKAYNLKSAILRIDNRNVEKGIVLLSKQVGIKTFVIYYGVLQDPNGHDIIFADRITVWGKREAQWYADLGNDPGKIAIVGKPYSGGATKDRKPEKREALANELGLTKKKFFITLIGPGRSKSKISSFTTDDATGVLIREVGRAVKSIGNANLVVKLHPNEKAKDYKRFNDETTVVIDKADLNSLLEESDVVIVKDSTVGLDAVIKQKPVIAVNLTKRPDLVPYAERGVAIGVHRREEIEEAVKKALYDEKAKRDMGSSREGFISDFAYKTDGKSTERILQLLESR